jgi:hypothetical protein
VLGRPRGTSRQSCCRRRLSKSHGQTSCLRFEAPPTWASGEHAQGSARCNAPHRIHASVVIMRSERCIYARPINTIKTQCMYPHRYCGRTRTLLNKHQTFARALVRHYMAASSAGPSSPEFLAETNDPRLDHRVSIAFIVIDTAFLLLFYASWYYNAKAVGMPMLVCNTLCYILCLESAVTGICGSCALLCCA